jgi:hypothetical protein
MRMAEAMTAVDGGVVDEAVVEVGEGCKRGGEGDRDTNRISNFRYLEILLGEK